MAQFYCGEYAKSEANLDRAMELTQTLEEGEAHFANKIKLLRGKARLQLKEETKKVGEINIPDYGSTKASISGGFKIDLNYDWYQNVTHTFVSYKVISGSDPESNVKVEVSEHSIILENSKNGEILAQVDLSNSIDPTNSTTAFSAKRIEIKLMKAQTNVNWPTLETTANPKAV
jgi:hypothetical protein